MVIMASVDIVVLRATNVTIARFERLVIIAAIVAIVHTVFAVNMQLLLLNCYSYCFAYKHKISTLVTNNHDLYIYSTKVARSNITSPARAHERGFVEYRRRTSHGLDMVP